MMSYLAAAAFALGISAPAVGCVPVQTRIDNAIESREGRIARDLGDIVDSVYCVRTRTEYALDGAPEGTPTVSQAGHGTAFAYGRRDGHVYLVTNAHVVDDPETFREVEMVPGPGGFAVVVNTYTKVGEHTYLVDNVSDDDPSDDIEVEEVAKDDALDIAVIRTDSDIHVAGSYVRETGMHAHLGEDVYVVGYPRGRFSAVTRGMVSHPDFVDEDGERLDVLDVTSTFGNSGSPYFVRRGGTLYWAGTMGKIMPYRGNSATMFTLGTPLRLYSGLLDDVPAAAAPDAGDAGAGALPDSVPDDVSGGDE